MNNSGEMRRENVEACLLFDKLNQKIQELKGIRFCQAASPDTLRPSILRGGTSSSLNRAFCLRRRDPNQTSNNVRRLLPFAR